MPPNALSQLTGQYDQYVVVGSGKTGMDACLFLLNRGVKADAIRWIMPRDAWLLDRAFIQPGELFADSISNAFFQQSKIMSKASSLKELLESITDLGLLIRFDDNVWPTMYRCATVTTSELKQLKQITGIIRQGRVSKIATTHIELEQGQVPTTPTTLHIDCTADGLQRRPDVSVFSGKQITLQSVRTCQQVFSAAFIAHVEVAYDEEEQKNFLCTPVPHPNTEIDFLRTGLLNALNGAHWAADEALTTWLKNARLDGFTTTTSDQTLSTQELAQQKEIMEQMHTTGIAAIENMQRLLAQAES
ncbi:MAG: hypothetical protein GXP16_19660 [Gammaproteobacteria bacterium]|nr:hypothetical protein [Gammaproteobacteria bacterium]